MIIWIFLLWAFFSAVYTLLFFPAILMSFTLSTSVGHWKWGWLVLELALIAFFFRAGSNSTLAVFIFAAWLVYFSFLSFARKGSMRIIVDRGIAAALTFAFVAFGLVGFMAISAALNNQTQQSTTGR